VKKVEEIYKVKMEVLRKIAVGKHMVLICKWYIIYN
jgi:hypothetical protein